MHRQSNVPYLGERKILSVSYERRQWKNEGMHPLAGQNAQRLFVDDITPLENFLQHTRNADFFI